MSPVPLFRIGLRLPIFLVAALAASLDCLVRASLSGGAMRTRALWLERWTKVALLIFGVRTRVVGTPPSGGLLVSNHLGYLDIFVLASMAPLIFVSRADVRRWPLAGFLARLGGTIFIDRSRMADVVRVNDTLRPIVESGQAVAVFLEGTSTGGDRVLPFKPSLLPPAIAGGWNVTPAYLRYEVPGGDASRDVAYWGDMVFFPHLMRFLGLPRVNATVHFGAPVRAAGERRALADALHGAVVGLGARPS